jgi:hypothetical protein
MNTPEPIEIFFDLNEAPAQMHASLSMSKPSPRMIRIRAEAGSISLPSKALVTR